MPTSYMSVKEAIREQEMARLFNRQNRPATVRLPPTWSEVHARDPLQHMQRSSPTGKVGFPRAEDGLLQPSVITASATSSVAHGPPGSPASNRVPDRSALGGSSKSGLNHTSTYFYGEAPLKPDMCDRNQYNMVGSYSMFGSQVRARARADPPPHAGYCTGCLQRAGTCCSEKLLSCHRVHPGRGSGPSSARPRCGFRPTVVALPDLLRACRRCPRGCRRARSASGRRRVRS